MPDTASAATDSLLLAENITKTFGELAANDAVTLQIAPGEIHALLGENGAGKSTLVKILFGALQPDSGTIQWRGTQQTIASPLAARKLGIGMVFQHFSLFDPLSAAENIALSLDTGESQADIAQKAKELSERYGLPLDPTGLRA